jgi:hypothetical protein
MSYYTEIQLRCRVRKEKLKQVLAEIRHIPPFKESGLREFLCALQVRDPDVLRFKAQGVGWSDWDVDEEDGLLDALNNSWCDFEQIASWLALNVTEGSQIIIHSLEGDGADFAYEFDGEGNYLYMAYRPVGTWQHAKKLTFARLPTKKEKNRKKKIKAADDQLKQNAEWPTSKG